MSKQKIVSEHQSSPLFNTWDMLKHLAGCYCLSKLHKCLIKITFVRTVCLSIFFCLFQALDWGNHSLFIVRVNSYVYAHVLQLPTQSVGVGRLGRLPTGTSPMQNLQTHLI